MEKEKIEVQDIVKKYGKEYKEKHKIMPHVAKAMGAIEKCRTEQLGYHEDICDECGYKKISYNSCRYKKIFITYITTQIYENKTLWITGKQK